MVTARYVPGSRLSAAGTPLSAIAPAPFQSVVPGLSGPVEGAVLLLTAALVISAGYRFVGAYFHRPSVEVVRNEPDSIFSDRDRVLLLIERQGGRVRQRQIVEQVEWSKAKVSRLLSELEEEGVIRKVRLGRENLVCLESRYPFEED